MRLTEQEISRALRQAVNTTTRRARAVVRKSLRNEGVRARTINRRIKGQSGRVWLGVNPVPVGDVEGAAVKTASGTVTVGGKPDPTAFEIPRGKLKGQVFRRRGPRPLPIDGVRIDFPGGSVALEEARSEAEGVLADNFERAAERLLSR